MIRIRFIVLIGIASCLQAQVTPTAAEIVRSVHQTYAGMKQIDFSMTIIRRTVVDSQITKETTFGMRIATGIPDKLRLEFDEDAMKAAGATGGGSEPSLTIFDGSNTWFYDVGRNQYGVQPGDASVGPRFVDDFMPDYGVMLKDDAQLLREETIEVNGGRINCFVLEISEERGPDLFPQSWTWWVDKVRHLVYRADRKTVAPRGSDEATILFRNLRLNEPVADDLFVFTPPPGARKVDQ